MADNLPSQSIQTLLKKVTDHFDGEDRSIREQQIVTWRRLKLMWEGFHKTWYDEVAHDWRIYNEETEEDSHYDKPINVFRAYLESIIAALSVVVPPVKCFPDDAENTLDLLTAKNGDKIGQLIYRHNDVSLLWLHMLYIYCTEGLVACHHYTEEKDEYGTYEVKHYKTEKEQVDELLCPACGHIIDEFPTPDELLMPEPCPNCNQEVTPVRNQKEVENEVLDRIESLPKSRVKLDAYGGLYVKIPNYAKKQADCPYLTLSLETHYANAIEKYAHLHAKRDQLTYKKIQESRGPADTYEELSRISPQYQGDYPEHVVTIKTTWLRPCAFNVLTEEESKILKKEYPEGCSVVYVNNSFAEVNLEKLDEEWTLSYNPLSDFLHHDPIGLLLVSIQEITNSIISLILQTIEHGIPQTFADPGVLNFDAYRQMAASPGAIIEAKPKSGRSVSDAFHDVKTAALSPEILPFFQQVQSLGQLVSGALPSLFGGQLEGSETASQYSMSRAQALQRLQNVWKIFNILWKNSFSKAIPKFIAEVKEDERDVQQDKDGNFINVLIKKSELEGKIGKIELEASDGIPLTWAQRKDVVMQLLTASSPEVLAIINAPENLTAIRDAIGLTDFVVPGEDDKNRQYDEIKGLLNSEPIPTGEPEGEVNEDGTPTVPFVPSIEVDPDFDDHKIHFEVCKHWVMSEAGQQAKIDNEAGYQNVLLHAKTHLLLMEQAMMAQVQQEQGAAPNAKPDITKTKEAPITGDNDVQTV